MKIEKKVHKIGSSIAIVFNKLHYTFLDLDKDSIVEIEDFEDKKGKKLIIKKVK